MEFFTNANIDFLGKKWYFLFFLSDLQRRRHVARCCSGTAFPLGVDFRGGTLVYVKYSHTPDPEADSLGNRARRPEERPRAALRRACE